MSLLNSISSTVIYFAAFNNNSLFSLGRYNRTSASNGNMACATPAGFTTTYGDVRVCDQRACIYCGKSVVESLQGSPGEVGCVDRAYLNTGVERL